MRFGPFIFLGLLGAMALSWLGMVVTPQLQFGGQQATNVPPTNVLYPTATPGVATFGREVYRANGCAYCHTQIIRQEGAELAVVVTDPGTNQPAVIDAIVQLRTGLSAGEAERHLSNRPATVLRVSRKAVADAAQKSLSTAGAEAAVRVIPIGPDIQRGWGTRLSVGADYLYATPLMLGSTRIGPDLTNVGLRKPDANWHLLHLYDPKSQVVGSIMPRYPYLFTTRPRGLRPSPEALPISGDREVIPTREARALVAYLLSLRAEMPLFEAPAPPLVSASSTTNGLSADTNSVSTVTNGPATSPGGPQ